MRVDNEVRELQQKRARIATFASCGKWAGFNFGLSVFSISVFFSAFSVCFSFAFRRFRSYKNAADICHVCVEVRVLKNKLEAD